MNRILLLLDHTENRRLLKDLLEVHYAIDESLEEPFDLCIVDGLALKRCRQQLEARRKAEEPICLPFLLLTSSHHSEQIAESLQHTVDDAIFTPIEKLELIARINAMLRSRQLSLELKEANEQLRELNALKTRFVAMAAHDLRNPLTAILMNSQLLEEQSDRLAQEKRHRLFKHIHTSVRNMSNLLEDILVISRSEEGKLSFNPTELNLAHFCYDLISEFELSAVSKHKIQFQEIYSETDLVCLDEKLLRHICSNLLSNAIKYSPGEKSVRFEVTCRDREIVLIFADEGIGIPPDKQERLFEPFYRASNVGEIPGTGLGLSIVKQCVDLHGGAIAVNSQPGKGTVFTVTLFSNQ